MKEITFIMGVKNVIFNDKEEIFTQVIKQASKLSKKFIITNNRSTDRTKKLIFDLGRKYRLDLQYNEYRGVDFETPRKTNALKAKTKYVFVLDDDEVLSDQVIAEVKENIDENYQIFFFTFVTYFLDRKIMVEKRPFMFAREFCPLRFNVQVVHRFWDMDQIRALPSEKRYEGLAEVHHFSFPTVESTINKKKFYESHEAHCLFEADKTLTNLALFKRYLGEIFRNFFYLLGNSEMRHSLTGIFYLILTLSSLVYKYLYYMELRKTELRKKAPKEK